jgi:heat-inducible transcriptional repressor
MDPPTALAIDDVRRAQAEHPAKNEIEEIILQTCRILTGLTHYASIATDPSTSSTNLCRVYLSGASPRHVLLVVLISTGHVEHRLVEFDQAPTDNVLSLVSGYVNSRVANHDIEEVARGGLVQDLPGDLIAHSGTVTRILSTVGQISAGLLERRVYLEGASQLLRQPEFHDVQRLENLLNALEQNSALKHVFRHALQGREMTIVIGSENQYEPMRECSLVLKSYRIDGRPVGYLGVVGPTRMNYDRSVAAVAAMAENLSLMLTSLSVA